jgi:hypothetical protein
VTEHTTAFRWPVCGLAAPEELTGHPDRLLANGPGVPVTPCGENALGFASFACIHEHVTVVDICGTCACELQRAAGLLVCDHCEDGPAPHECRPRVEITWFDGTAVTTVQEASDV